MNTMTEAVEKIAEDMKFVKEKVAEIDKELHKLREEFEEAHLTDEEQELLAKAREEYRKGKTKPLEQLEKEL